MKKFLILIIFMVCILNIKSVNAEINHNYLKSISIADIHQFEGEPNSIADKGFCTRLKSPLKFIGYILLIVKIVIPLILIVFGIIDLFKAVTAGKDGEVAKSLKSLAFRIIAGVAIFFVPTIISFVFSLVDGFDSVKSEYDICQRCILDVSKC